MKMAAAGVTTLGKEKIVALDIGGVCISLHPGRILRALGLSPLLKPPARFLEACTLLETGRMSNEEWFRIFSEYTGGRFRMEELAEIWNSMIGPDIPGMADAVRSLLARGGYRFVFFSNTSAMHLMQVLRMCSFCHLVTGGVFSYEAGAMKPDPGMYEAFEKAYGVPCLYFDDREENVEAARRRGWSARVFTSAESFLACFENEKMNS